MDDSIFSYWQKRLKNLKKALELNNYEVFIADNASKAHDLVISDIIPVISVKRVSWGGSKTLLATNLCNYFKESAQYEVFDTFDHNISREEMLEVRRRALMTDLFITGTNAITQTGQLVNLDMIGNRVGGINFGPRNVIILAGRNKIVADLDSAWARIKNYAAPVNSMRLDMKTPCIKTGTCEDCKSPQRICNIWSITEKSFPKGRIKIVLINEDLGF